tara:strand:+ start:2211 stop:2903 length:693 start_codon:yes stop_codon:yes gene_type:complete
MKLLTTTGNTKVEKTNKDSKYLMASLSLMPDSILCPNSKNAECFEPCLKSAGFAGVYKTVNQSRQRKTDYWHSDKKGFLKQLERELTNHVKNCEKKGKKPACRLNTISDIVWEKTGIIEKFPQITFLDYTKNASRLGKTPKNYKLIFSYSNAPNYQTSVKKAFKTDAPIAVVFKGRLPKSFNGRQVINGDKSDLVNSNARGKIIGLLAKGKARNDGGNFVVDPDLIAVGA